MDFERAIEINSACFAHSMWKMGLQEEKPPSLQGYTLQEMLDAPRVIRQHEKETKSTTIRVICADRLIAALYALYNFDAETEAPMEPAARRPGAALVIVSTKDEG